MSQADEFFARARAGDRAAFASWMGSVEFPIRLSLRRFAQAVDVESIVQETLLRMWLLSQDAGRALTGEDAALKFAIVLARNLARNEARRFGRERFLPPMDVPEIPVEPDPPADPGLMRAIRECVEQLKGKARQALQARLGFSGLGSDRDLAASIGMTLNTFLQNIVRARKSVEACLEKRGLPLHEVMP
ncbi:MAG TPA: hypothetical protein VFS09_13570 [Candidatus Eisenbacteria bacterium]|nr:hypothetical protein [Candidatus Eisenbacteria bacterium]